MSNDQRRYFAYADSTGRAHGHVLMATSSEAAAVGYTELHTPPVDGDDDIRIFVTDLDDGNEHCFTIDLNGSDAAPCT